MGNLTPPFSVMTAQTMYRAEPYDVVIGWIRSADWFVANTCSLAKFVFIQYLASPIKLQIGHARETGDQLVVRDPTVLTKYPHFCSFLFLPDNFFSRFRLGKWGNNYDKNAVVENEGLEIWHSSSIYIDKIIEGKLSKNTKSVSARQKKTSSSFFSCNSEKWVVCTYLYRKQYLLHFIAVNKRIPPPNTLHIYTVRVPVIVLDLSGFQLFYC